MEEAKQHILNAAGSWTWEEKSQFIRRFLDTLTPKELQSSRNITGRYVRRSKYDPQPNFAAAEEHPGDEVPLEKPSAAVRRKRVGSKDNQGWWSTRFTDEVVGVDLEMVAVPIPGKFKKGRQAYQQVVGIVGICNYYGEELYYEKVHRKTGSFLATGKEKNGITASFLENGKPLNEVLKEVTSILKDKLVVGFALDGDFRALGLESGDYDIFDLQWHWWRSGQNDGDPFLNFSLKALVKHFIGDSDFQTGNHNALLDATMTVTLFRDFYVKNEKKGDLMSKYNEMPSDFINS